MGSTGVGKNGELVSQPTLTVEELRAIVDETHGWGKKVACHAYSGEGLQRALDGGCDSIEHGLVLTDAQIAQMIRQGTWLCPTLSVYYLDWAPADTPDGQRDRKRVSEHEASFRKALEAGVKIAFGTDMGGIPWTEPIAAGISADGRIGHDADAGDPERNFAGGGTAGDERAAGRDCAGGLCGRGRGFWRSAGERQVLENVGFVMKDGKVFKNEIG